MNESGLKRAHQMSRFAGFYMQTLIILEQHHSNLNGIVRTILQSVCQLQTVSYLIVYSLDSLVLHGNKNFKLTQFHLYLPYLCRPNLLLTPQYQTATLMLAFCLFLWLVCLHLGIIAVFIYNNRSNEEHFQSLNSKLHFESTSSLLQPILTVLGTSIQIIMVIMILPLSELCLTAAIENAYSSEVMRQVFAWLALTTMVLIQIFNVVRILVSEETISMEINGLALLNQTSLNMVGYLLRIGQVILFVLATNEDITLYLQQVLSIFVIVLSLTNLIHNKPTLHPRQALVITLGINISIWLVLLFIETVRILDRLHEGTLILIVFPIISFLLLTYQDMIEQQDLMHIKRIQNPNRLQFLIASGISEQSRFQSTSSGIVMQTFILQKHRKKCNVPICFCQVHKQPWSDPKLVQIVSETIYEDHYFLALKRFNKIIQRIKTDYEKFSYVLHYISGLSLCGHNTQAYQQTNLMIFKRRKETQLSGLNARFDERHSISSQLNSSSRQERTVSAYDSLNEKLNKLFKVLSVQPHSQLNFIQYQKMMILQQMIKVRMNQTFMAGSNQAKAAYADDLSHAVYIFLEGEAKHQFLKSKVVRIFQEKLSFYNILTSQTAITGGDVFNKSKQLTNQLYNLERYLNQLYASFPSQRVQSILCFFHAEIQSNYMAAIKYSSINSISDEKLINMYKNLPINLFSNKVTYLIVGFKDHHTSLHVLDLSSNSPEFLGYEQAIFKNQPNIQFLLPHGMQKMHTLLVNNFLTNGQSRFFRQINLNFVLGNDSLIYPVQFFYDINFTDKSNFSFVTFIQKVSYSNAYMMVDFDGFIGGVTQNFFEKIGYTQNDINKISVVEALYALKIVQCIPQFFELIGRDELSMTQPKDTIPLENVAMQFLPKQAIMALFPKSDSSLGFVAQRRKAYQQSAQSAWQSGSSFLGFQVQLVVHSRPVMGQYYYILEINDIKQTGYNEKLFSTTTYNKTSTKQLREMETQQLTSQRNEQGQHFLDKQELSEIDVVEQFQVSIEMEINKPAAMEIIEKDRASFEEYQDNIGFQNKSMVIKNNSFQHDDDAIFNMFSPNNSISHALFKQDNSLSQLKKRLGESMAVQQKFFSKEHSQSLRNSASNQNEGQKHIQNQMDIDPEIQKDLLRQLQQQGNPDDADAFNDRGSQVSSRAGVRKSLLYGKYDMIMKILAQRRKPFEIVIMNLFLALMYISSCIYCIIILTYIKQDLPRFMQEVDMLQIQNHFLAPADQLSILIFAIQKGKIRERDNPADVELIEKLNKYNFENFVEAYSLIKQDVVSELSNPYIQDFFTDQYIEMAYLADDNHLVHQNVPTKVALTQFITSVYEMASTFFKDEYSDDQEVNFFIFRYANYLKLIEHFTGLVVNILDYNFHRTIIVSDRWNLTWIPFQVINAALVVLSWLIYRKYNKKYERFLSIFKHIQNSQIEQDKEKIKIFLNLLANDYNMIFEYKFDIEQKEAFLAKQYIRQERQENNKAQVHKLQQRVNPNLQNLRLNILPSVLIICLLYFVFFTLSYNINQSCQDYLKKFANTAEIFRDMSDLGYYVPSVFIAKELSFRIKDDKYFFLTEKARGKLKDEFNKGLEAIAHFLEETSVDNWQEYLFSDAYLSYFIEIQHGSLCKLLNPDLQARSKDFCSFAFDGSLDRGMLITLSYIKSMLTNQDTDSKGFRNPIESINMYEPVGEYLLHDIVNGLRRQLKNGLTDITNSKILLLDSLCYITLVYSILSIIIFATFITTHLAKEYSSVTRFVMLLPSGLILQDDQFERALRLLLVQERII